ncbi:MAG: dienelactone hydrolase family protein [Gammaproteobacteria bacterium]|nr:dienelactone hydrolase family protein [Gammaproteobacteria bacterium]
MNLLPHLTATTNDNPTASVIWLHGLGANGHDFHPIVPELGIPKELGIRFIFPHAPSIPVTINNNFVMPAWYDILEMTLDRKVDEKQLRESAKQVNNFIQNEIEQGIPSEKIIIAGFSQGGAVALEAALSFDKPLGGLLAMSTYFATKDSIQLNSANQELPIEVNHGIYDPVVPEALGRTTAAFLQEKQYKVTYRTYPMEHAVCPQQIRDLGQFFKQHLA